MKSLVLTSATALILAGAGSAQTLIQPGQTGLGVQRSNSNPAADPYREVPKVSIASVQDTHDRFLNRLWMASIFGATAGTSLDAATSWGKHEGNPLLASSDGRFGAKGLGIKAGLTAGFIIPQICLRKHKDLRAAFTIGNFVDAGIFAGTSVHNLQVRSDPGVR